MNIKLDRIESPFVFELSGENANCFIDASESIGGKGRGLRPMELVAGGLAGCVAIDVLRILEKQRIHSDHFRIRIDAKRKDAVPAPFESILLTIEVDSSIDAQQLSKNVELVIEKYCSVSASLDDQIKIEFKIAHYV